jgi:hypothetical protein
MKDAQGAQVLGHTKWKRFALVMVPAVAVGGLVMAGIANGAIAASISFSGQSFEVSASELQGTGFVQYGTVDQQDNLGAPGKTANPVAFSGIKQATLTNLCQSVVTHVPLLGDVTLTISAPTAKASNLLIHLTNLSGNATFNNVDIGADAATVTDGPVSGGSNAPTPGSFAQQATSITVLNLHQTADFTNAGTFELDGMSMSVSKGAHPCF